MPELDHDSGELSIANSYRQQTKGEMVYQPARIWVSAKGG